MVNKSRALKLFWPEIKDAPSAKAASRLGVWATGISCIWTAIAETYTLLFPGAYAIHFGVGGYIDAVVLSLLAVGIWRMWRNAAVIALLLFILDQMAAGTGGRGLLGIFVPLVLIPMFINGVRGTFAFRRFPEPTGAPGADA